MDYVYIDESGELAKQTKYFVIGAIIVKNPNILDRLIKKARIIQSVTFTSDVTDETLAQAVTDAGYKIKGIK